jgi:hypothetical protein
MQIVRVAATVFRQVSGGKFIPGRRMITLDTDGHNDDSHLSIFKSLTCINQRFPSLTRGAVIHSTDNTKHNLLQKIETFVGF